ncbi:hypothetical protein SULI_05075 [Saccharolobus solfataricus]|uniref:Uncharacterized protein n=2 Tax=Saccharolobus solfataricus TaxID=2287 RepID=A0A0E3GT84_SACSO|nr:hypothetical protein [Saccharolobus solfataricus]AKA73376.1 hypothetical protein SULB_1035 [Saccharolobus solfataricus]AKA76075.1 hypothetical protein SULC_1034 [Saccharolobus solfataricus]AKA78768.1 hypothetical protein SULA_1033 [Saccharolobus solfataricus]AZF67844.1 hypothetical protein SULG_05075 [Saccharolobus solfataricus]AZF70464.1 hypothetical protein SULH_05075 [Saccharolobus solfataricus]
MVDILNSTKDVETFLSKQKDKCKLGDIVTFVTTEDTLESIPFIASKYGFSMVDGENLEEDLIMIKLEFRQIFR